MIVHDIARAIQRNPKINKVIVSPLEHAKIRRELNHMTFFKRDPRPTYGAPFGDTDRQFWDMKVQMQRCAEVRIMGRPVIRG